MSSDLVQLVIQADTTAFSASVRQAEQEFSSRFKQMSSTSGAQSKRIKRDFNLLAESAQSFSKGLKQTAKQLTILAGTATGIGLLGKRIFEVADGIAETADRVGISTTFLQEVGFASVQAGVSTEKLAASLSQFTKRIGDASNGVGSAASTYEALNIELIETDGSLRSSEAVLNDVADALSKMDSQAERAAVATALFGKEGVALSLLLKDGSKGLEIYREQARALGIVIDENLLRSSEKALDQFDILSQVIKSQLVSAFVTIAPTVMNFTQSIIAAIPSVKEYLGGILEFKDALILVGKTILGIKLFSLSKDIIVFSKLFVIALGATTKLAAGFTLLSKALKGLGIGLAVGTLVEGLTLLKQHLDFKESVRNYIDDQQSIINANQQFANVTRISIDAFKNLSSAEQLSYKERLQAAQAFWQARLNLESRKDFKSDIALEAAKEKRLLLEHISSVNVILERRNQLERAHAEQINQLKKDESNQLKSNLMEQLKAYDESNNKLVSLQEKRKTIAKEFQDLIQEINSAPQKSDEELTVLDINSSQENAKAALKSGNHEQAFQAINQAKSLIQTLSKTGNVSKNYLSEQTKASADIADDVVQSEIQAQEANLVSIKATITQIKADAELLKHLTVEFDVNGAVQSAEALRKQIQDQLANNPLMIPAVVVPEGQNLESRAKEILKPLKKARGGLILGPGTTTSDSILARLSRGEFVVRASAVKRYGVGLLNSLNQLNLPKFSAGGLVPPRVPVIGQTTTSSQQVANLTLNLGSKNYNLQTQNVDVVQALTKAVAREALKSGRRL